MTGPLNTGGLPSQVMQMRPHRMRFAGIAHNASSPRPDDDRSHPLVNGMRLGLRAPYSGQLQDGAQQRYGSRHNVNSPSLPMHGWQRALQRPLDACADRVMPIASLVFDGPRWPGSAQRPIAPDGSFRSRLGS